MASDNDKKILTSVLVCITALLLHMADDMPTRHKAHSMLTAMLRQDHQNDELLDRLAQTIKGTEKEIIRICKQLISLEQTSIFFSNNIPKELVTEQAMKLWTKLQKEDLIDENLQQKSDPETHQPLSQYKAAIIANVVAEKLGIGKHKWKIFSMLWTGLSNKEWSARFSKAMTDRTYGLRFEEYIKKLLQ